MKSVTRKLVWIVITYLMYWIAYAGGVIHIFRVYGANDLILMMWEGPTLALRGGSTSSALLVFWGSLLMWPAWTAIFQHVHKRSSVAIALIVFCVLQYGVPLVVITQDMRHVHNFVTCLITQANYTIPQAVFYLVCQCGYLGYALAKFVKGNSIKRES